MIIRLYFHFYRKDMKFNELFLKGNQKITHNAEEKLSIKNQIHFCFITIVMFSKQVIFQNYSI